MVLLLFEMVIPLALTAYLSFEYMVFLMTFQLWHTCTHTLQPSYLSVPKEQKS